ncbi:unnamed protein product [Cercopithifilaria johnstoni]|uniref:Uncharacterized protein n=1 Tax=Cercopithifilaria johnstoni TaxID=2874296 RepID=A0A8J2M309_9BILA|nr:unnamed protein product [Cercopithifilaria johnstoni]
MIVKFEACVKRKAACIAQIGELQHREHGHDGNARFDEAAKKDETMRKWEGADDFTIGGEEGKALQQTEQDD